MQGIYAIRNVINGRTYIGSSVDIEERWYIHRWALANNRRPLIETRAKMSAARKGRAKSPEHRAKIAAAKCGVKLSDSHRAAIVAGHAKAREAKLHIDRQSGTVF